MSRSVISNIARVNLPLVMGMMLLTASATVGQGNVTLQDTSTWITDFLETHGCSVTNWTDTRDGKDHNYKTCSVVAKVKGCTLTVRQTDPDNSFDAFFDLTEADRKSVTIDDSFTPAWGVSRGPGKTVGIRKAGGKAFPTSGSLFSAGLSVNDEKSAMRLQKALSNAVDLCVTQSPF